MTYLYHIGACLGLVVLQTTIMPYFRLFDKFYDLLIPFVLYLGLFRPPRESIPVILFFGFVMDYLCGGPFGLYLTTYLWIFIGVSWMIKFLHIGNMVLLPVVVSMAVLVENSIFLVTLALLEQESMLPADALSTVAVQMVWALFTGPFFLVTYFFSHRRWEKWINELVAQWTGQSG